MMDGMIGMMVGMGLIGIFVVLVRIFRRSKILP